MSDEMNTAEYLGWLQRSLEMLRDQVTELIEDVRVRKEMEWLEEGENGGI